MVRPAAINMTQLTISGLLALTLFLSEVPSMIAKSVLI